MNGMLAAAVIGLPVLLWLVLIVVMWRRAKRVGRRRRLAGQLIAIHIGAALLLACLIFKRSAPVATPLLSANDKIALRQGIRIDPQTGLRTVRLDGNLLARGLRTAASLADQEVHSQFRFSDDGTVAAEMAWRLPGGVYLPLRFVATPQVIEGELDLDVARMRLGRIPVPWPCKQLFAAAALDAARLLPVTSDALAALHDIEVSADQLTVKAQPDSDVIDQSLVLFDDAGATARGEAAAEAIRSWLQLPRGEGEQWFADSLRHLFRTVAASRPAWPPSRQNAAAILAAGVAFGEPRLANFTQVPLSAEELAAAKKHAATASVHKRRDLVQHFVLSAAIAEVASGQFSSFLGLSKEEVDSGEGGSGFSFADLAADRAGVAFQRRACDDDTAAAIQAWLATSWEPRHLVPLVESLPEGLDEAAFQNQFGNTQDPRFLAAVKAIDEQIAKAAWMK